MKKLKIVNKDIFSLSWTRKSDGKQLLLLGFKYPKKLLTKSFVYLLLLAVSLVVAWKFNYLSTTSAISSALLALVTILLGNQMSTHKVISKRCHVYDRTTIDALLSTLNWASTQDTGIISEDAFQRIESEVEDSRGFDQGHFSDVVAITLQVFDLFTSMALFFFIATIDNFFVWLFVEALFYHIVVTKFGKVSDDDVFEIIDSSVSQESTHSAVTTKDVVDFKNKLEVMSTECGVPQDVLSKELDTLDKLI